MKVGICQRRTDPDFGGLMAPWMAEECQVQVQVDGCPRCQEWCPHLHRQSSHLLDILG